MEKFAEDAELLGRLRESLWQEGMLTSALEEGQAEAGAKFSDYFDASRADPEARLRTAPWRCCAGATKACCASRWWWGTKTRPHRALRLIPTRA